jgi:hypothetical protein
MALGRSQRFASYDALWQPLARSRSLQHRTPTSSVSRPQSVPGPHIDRIARFGHRQTVKDGPNISITAAQIGDPAGQYGHGPDVGGLAHDGRTRRGSGRNPVDGERASRKARILRIVISRKEGPP